MPEIHISRGKVVLLIMYHGRPVRRGVEGVASFLRLEHFDVPAAAVLLGGQGIQRSLYIFKHLIRDIKHRVLVAMISEKAKVVE